MENLIKEHENQISVLKQQLAKKEKLEKELSSEFKSLADKTSVLSKNHSNLLEINYQLKNEHEYITKTSGEEKTKFELKVKELIEIIEQQSRELDDYGIQFERLEKENSVLNSRLDNYKLQFDEINRQIPEFQKNFEYLNLDRGKMEDLSHELEKLLKEEKVKTERLSLDKEELIGICENFEEKNKEFEVVNGEIKRQLGIAHRDLDENRYIFELLIYIIYRTINANLNKNVMILEKKCGEFEAEFKELTISLNYEFTTIIQWIDTYFGVYFQKSVEIPSLPRTQSQVVHNKIPKFDSLKECLTIARKAADKELNNYENLTNELKEESNANNLKINKFISEVSNFKETLHNKNNELYAINNKIDKLAENYELLEEENKKLHTKMQEIGNKNSEFGNKITSLIQEIFGNFRTTRYQKYAELINYQSYSENRVN